MNFKHLAIFPAVAILAACGGGDSGGLPAQTIPTAGSSLVTSVPTPTYATASEELAAFTRLNSERERCGFGLLKQDTGADTAALGHADWNLINGYYGHYQTTGTNGFTGVSPYDRLIAASYASTSGDFTASDLNVVYQPGTTISGTGVQGILALLNAPYHAMSILSGYRDIGLAVRNTDMVIRNAGVSTGRTLQVNLAYKTANGEQLQAGSDILTYPCQGSTDVVSELRGESPNPVPGRDLATQPLGSTITIRARTGQQLAITSATLMRMDTSAAVTLRTPVTQASDPNNILSSHQAYVSADAPLDKGVAYQATINGTNNGTAFSRTFSFTTGN